MNMFHLKKFHSDRGVALVIILAFVVLLAILITAFFSRALLNRQIAGSSASRLKAEQIAQGAFAAITTELEREMAAGSTIVDVQGQRVFQPKELTGGQLFRQAWLPQRNGVPASLPNLVKTSSATDPFYFGTDYDTTNFPSQLPATNVSAETPDITGRFVRRERWNLPKLLPQAAFDQDFVSPEWTVVTRAGFGGATPPLTELKDAAPDNRNFAVGRFAYAIYDVGGLLDINVAGGISGSGTGGYSEVPQELNGRKGSLGFADLGDIPGITDPDALVRWRNKHTAADGSFTARDFPAPASPDYVKYLLDSDLSRAHLRIYPGDHGFLNRQDLLQYVEAKSGQIQPEALLYLTTFSNTLNAPSWSPTNPIPPSWQSPQPTLAIDYEAEANAPRATALTAKPNDTQPSTGLSGNYVNPTPNRNLVRTTWSQNRTIQNWDGELVEVKAGEPIVRRRFPLSRIDLLRQHQEATATEKPALERKIQYSFGLVPDPGLADGWVYQPFVYLSSPNLYRLHTVDEMDGSAPAGAQNFENREPNFFELLRAGILRGEIGTWNTVDDDLDAAIMISRIGANIIDQYDTDSYPTNIRLDPGAGASSPYPIQISGIENLPYFSEVMLRSFRKPEGPDNDPQRQKVWTWMEFELWNPHANAGDVAAADAPEEFRIVAVAGEGTVRPQDGNNNLGPIGKAARDADPTFYDTTPIDFASAYASLDNNSNPNQIQFRYPDTSTFQDPTILGSTDAPIVTYPNVSEQVYSHDGTQVQGIFLGVSDNTNAAGELVAWPDWNLSVDKRTTYAGQWFSIGFVPTADSLRPVFAIEYKDKRNGDRWVPYQGFSVIRGGNFWLSFNTGGSTTTYGPNPVTSSPGRSMTNLAAYGGAYSRFDPRGTRFRNLLNSHNSPATPGFSVRPDSSRGLSGTGIFQNTGTGEYSGTSGGPVQVGAQRHPQSTGNKYHGDVAENTGNSLTHSVIRGRDGIQRPGDSDKDRGVHPLINTEIGDRTRLQAVLNADSTAAALVGPERLSDRPYFLNRPFHSVAEMGYAFRDLPWKTINFSSSVSAEAALLDLFSVTESPFENPLVAGTINLNSAPAPVLQSMLSGALRTVDPASPVTSSAISSVVQDFIDMRTAQPLIHRSDLVPNFFKYLEENDKIEDSNQEPYPAIKTMKEAPVRAFAEAGTTRTWTFLIDAIAQTGRYPSSASSLEAFSVQSENRYWLHISMDRFTGDIIARQIEPVYE